MRRAVPDEARLPRPKSPRRAGWPSRVGVVGAGRMGSGIAAALGRVAPVVVVDTDPAALAHAEARLFDALEGSPTVRSASAATMANRPQILLTHSLEALAGSDLVIEAVPEEPVLKEEILGAVSILLGPEAVLASNTSCLPLSAIADSVLHPERLLGMHFFHPAEHTGVVEIVRTKSTSSRSLDVAARAALAAGKASFVVVDTPGFFSTRILTPYLDESLRLAEEGVPPDVVDRVQSDLGFARPPFRMLDELGLATAAAVGRHMRDFFGRRGTRSSSLLERMLEAGFGGRPGPGFYVYDSNTGEPSGVNPAVGRLVARKSRHLPTDRELEERPLLLMVNEAARCLHRGVLGTPADGDLAAVQGLGFPVSLGGPFRWVDTVGAAEVAARLEHLERTVGARFRPAPLFGILDAQGGRCAPVSPDPSSRREVRPDE